MIARFLLVPAAFQFLAVSAPQAAGAQALSVNPANFGSMTCQQLWYTEQEVLAEGRVCLKSERARTAFRRADRCISDDEAILQRKARDYLETLREVAGEKACPEF